MLCNNCGLVINNRVIVYEREVKKLCEKLGVDDDVVSRGYLDKNDDYKRGCEEIIRRLCGDSMCCAIKLKTAVDVVEIVK
jgi:hypothetical protein